MPRANRHYLPGYVWHITHRCHKKEFLLKFARDRRRWLQWLFHAKKRFGLKILNYMATSNHIHLLVADNGDSDTIPNSIQLIAGRIGQEFNQRKARKGASYELWEPEAPYNSDFGPESANLRLQNTYFWKISQCGG